MLYYFNHDGYKGYSDAITWTCSNECWMIRYRFRNPSRFYIDKNDLCENCLKVAVRYLTVV